MSDSGLPASLSTMSFWRQLDDRLNRVRLLGLDLIAPLFHGKRTRRCRKLGISLALDLDRYIDFVVFVRGTYEPEVLRAIDELLARFPGDGQFLDVGANIGLMSAYVAQAHPRVKVLAFEPVPELVNVIRKQQALNALSFDVLPVALSDADGEIELYPGNAVNPGLDHGKFNPGMTSAHPTPLHGSEPIRARRVRLDSLVGAGGVDRARPTVIKIDIEGHEACALDGMSDFLDAPDRALVVELLPATYPESVRHTWWTLEELGFRGSFLGRRQFHPIDAPLIDGNYVFERR